MTLGTGFGQQQSSKGLVNNWLSLDAAYSTREQGNREIGNAYHWEQWAQDVPSTHGLNYAYKGGVVDAVGGVRAADGTIALTDDIRNYVEYDPATGVVSVNTSSFTLGKNPMAAVTTQNGAVAAVEDWRLPGNAGGGGGPLLGTIDASQIVSGFVTPARGGLGFAPSAIGDMIYASAVGTWARRAIGAVGTVMISSGVVPAWAQINDVHVSPTAAIEVSKLEVPTRGAIIVGNSSPVFSILTLGATGKILRSDGSDLKYTTATYPDTAARGDLVRATASNVLGVLTIGGSATYLRSNATDPAWATISATEITTGNLPYAQLPTGGGTWANGGTLSITGGITTVAGLTSTADVQIGGVATSNTVIQTGAGARIRVAQDSAAGSPTTGLNVFGYGVDPVLALGRASGTLAAQGFPAAGETLGAVQMYGRTNTGAFVHSVAMRAIATSTWTASNQETFLVWSTTENGAVAHTGRWGISSAGHLQPMTLTGATADNLYTLGASGSRAANVYSVLGNYSGTLTASGGIALTGAITYANLPTGSGTWATGASANIIRMDSHLRIDSHIGMGAAPTNLRGIDAELAMSGAGGSVLSGMLLASTFTDTQGVPAAGFGWQITNSTAANAFTLPDMRGIAINTPTIGATSTVTIGYGLYIDDQTGAGTNYAIYTKAGTIRFGGAVIGPSFDTAAAADLLLKRNTTTILTLGAAVITPAVLLTTIASASGGAGFRLPHGAAPSSPVDGDVWSTSAGGLFAQINGVTKTVVLV